MAKEVGIGVIGSGLWAITVHLPAYQAHPQARLVGVYDVDPAGAARATLLATFYGTGERMNQGVAIYGQQGALKMRYSNQTTISASLEPLSDTNQFIELPIPDQYKTVGHDLRQNTVRNFINAIANDEAMTPNFEDGLRNQRVIDTVVASAREGAWFDVP
ncbi:MAG: Gfo/Idh/MocA family oxidoreductase [Caldilineaceae bacterium]